MTPPIYIYRLYITETKIGIFARDEKLLILTLLCGNTMNAPPPADSTMMARNFGLTAQNVESQLDLETRILS